MLQFENYKDVFTAYGKAVNVDLIAIEDKIETTEFQFSKYREDLPTEGDFTGLETNMVNFFSHAKNWKLEWATLPSADFSLKGSINILPLERINKISDTPFYPEDYPQMKGFRLLDYFYNEGAVGFYINQPEKGLFYFEFDGDPQELNLDFKGYLQLLVYTRGVGYWQLLIREHLEKKKKPGTDDIREHMPKLFPDFSQEGFIKLYESVRMRQ